MSHSYRYLIPTLLVLGAGATSANAVITQRLKNACRAEYYAYCSQHALGSEGLRSCMRAAQANLSQTCIKELVSAGEVSQAEVRAHKGAK